MTRLASVVSCLMLVACRGSSSTSQQPAPTHAPPPLSRQAAPAILHHHPITTANAEAQRALDEGFTLVFSFNHEEATRSFQRAAQLDPKAPMPQWGIAWAVGPNYNLDVDDARAKQAFEAIGQAKALAGNGSEAERKYIEALSIRYSADMKADRAALNKRYSDAMGALSHQFPDDLDAATLYAESVMTLRPWKLWSLDGQPAPGTETILSVLESVLRRDPQHIGANHYYIHAVEASTNPGRALPSAGRLETLVPAAGHLVHMPAHIYERTGDHAGAAKSNLAGAEADRAYFKGAPPATFYAIGYYSHNLHFLAHSHMMQGRLEDARRAATDVAAFLTPHADMMPMVESLAVMPTNVLLRFGRDDEILALPEPPGNRPVMRSWRHFARGVALARTGKPNEAAAERAELDKVRATVPTSALFGGTGLEPAATVLGVAATVLEARIAWAAGERDKSIGLWRQAVATADRLSYDEPPVWFYPLRESLGAALLLNGKAAEAEQAFRDDLVRHPRNPRSLFGLRESLARQNKTADAAWVDTAFKTAWRNADSSALALEKF